MYIEKHLEELRIILPTPSKSLGSYVPAIVAGSFVYISGVVPIHNGNVVAGKFGKNFNLENGKKIAELCALELISNLKETIKNLDRVKQIVMLKGFINSTDQFTGQSKVMNVVSDVMTKIFDKRGRHSRIAIGVNSLPLDAVMEVSAVAEI